MTEKRYSTNGYYIYDHFHDGEKWLVNEVEAEEIVSVMNNLDTKARERSKALSKLQKENYELNYKLRNCEDARQSYKQDWKACSSYCDEYKSKINSLKDEVKGLTEENKDNKAMIEFLDTENNQIMNELKTRTQIQHQLEEENEQLNQKIKLIAEILTEDIGYVESFKKIEEVLK